MTWPATILDIRVRIALAADRTADPSTWTWTDISAYVRHSPRAVISQGAADEWASAPPSSITLALDNRDGRFTRRNPTGPYYGQLGDYTPLEIAVDPDGSGWRVRGVGEVVEWPQSRDLSGADATVTVKVAGVTRRLGLNDQPLRSAPSRWLQTVSPAPVAAWTLEDNPGAVFGAPLVGVQRVRGFAGTHPSGAVFTAPQWGQGRLASWLPPVLSRSGSSGLTVIVAPISAAASTSWTIDHVYASGTDAGVSTVDVNPSYLGFSTGWPQLILTPSVGGVDVAMNGEPEVLGTHFGLYDGNAHHIRWTARQAGANVSWSVWVDGRLVNSGTTSGSMTLPATSILGLVAEAQAAASLAQGYLAVWTGTAPPLQVSAAAALGHIGEPAGRRIERLCDEERVRLVLVDPYRVNDDFDRTESAGWGLVTGTGEAWSTSGGSAADFDVAGQGTIEQSTAEVLRAVVLADPRQQSTFDVLVLVEVPAVASGGSVGMHAGIVARWTDDSNHVRCQLRYAPGGAGVTLGWVTPGGAGTAIGATATIAASYDAGDRYWLRAVGVGSAFRARAWADGTAEPHDWQAWGESDTYRSGVVGVFCRRGTGDTTSPATFAFESFAARSVLDETEPAAPQTPDTLLRLLRVAEDADQGRLQDAQTTIGLQYIPRVRRYNLPVALDLVPGDLGGVPVIQDDDQRRYGRVLATVPSGAVVELRDEAVIARAGGIVVTSPITPPVATDQRAEQAAWWHLSAGGVDRERWPQLPLNFARSPELIGDWLSAVPGGSRLQIAGGSFGPDVVDQLVEGWSETISQTVWRADLVCSPAELWSVGVLGSTTRPDTAGSMTVGDFDAGTDTALQVERAAGVSQLWTTRPADFPLDLVAAGVRLRATACSGSSDPQTFTITQTPVNGVVKTIPGGTPIRLADPWRLAL
jgi:hypothetical protein